jgi:hypothetical protein
MTRISNVFANAIFGALAVLFFAGALQNQIKNIHLDATAKQSVMAEAVNLGNAKAPSNIGPKDKTIVERSYHESFIHAYSCVMKISAGLGFLGAMMSFLFIRNQAVKKQ